MGLCYMQIVAQFMFTMQLLVFFHAIPKMNQHTISYYVMLHSSFIITSVRIYDTDAGNSCVITVCEFPNI